MSNLPRTQTLYHPLDVNTAAVHLVVEPHHRRSVEMPGQAVPEHAAAPQLALSNRIKVRHGIAPHAGRLFPRAAARAPAGLHFLAHPISLSPPPGRRRSA